MNPTLEVKTKVEVDKTMKLIDMNGKKISFRSDCFVKPNNPNDKLFWNNGMKYVEKMIDELENNLE